jgi:hypothetical protein
LRLRQRKMTMSLFTFQLASFASLLLFLLFSHFLLFSDETRAS